MSLRNTKIMGENKTRETRLRLASETHESLKKIWNSACHRFVKYHRINDADFNLSWNRY